MSLSLSRMVWDHSPHRGTPLLVLLALADTTQDKGDGWCYASMKNLAAKSRISLRIARSTVAALVMAGAVVVSPQSGKWGTNRFQVVPPQPGNRPKEPRARSAAQLAAARLGGGPRLTAADRRLRAAGVPRLTAAAPGLTAAGGGGLPQPDPPAKGSRTPRLRAAQTPAKGSRQDGTLTINENGTEDEGVLPPTPPTPSKTHKELAEQWPDIRNHNKASP